MTKNNDEMKSMIDAVFSGDKEKFETSFSNAIKDKLANNIASVHHNIAKDIIKTNHETDSKWTI